MLKCDTSYKKMQINHTGETYIDYILSCSNSLAILMGYGQGMKIMIAVMETRYGMD